MAKQKEAKPGTGMIIALVVFILGTFVFGALSYFIYSDQEQYAKATKDATKSKTDAEKLQKEEAMRKVVLRIAMGIETKEDRDDLVANRDTMKDVIADEHSRLVTKLRTNEATPVDFNWNVDGGGIPVAAPARNVPATVGLMRTKADAAAKEAKLAAEGQQKAEALAKEANDRAEKEREQFKTTIEAQATKQKAELVKLNDNLKSFQDEIKGLSSKVAVLTTSSADERDALQDKLRKLDENLAKTKEALSRYQVEDKARNTPDTLSLERQKGSIRRKDGDFVYIDLGSAQFLRAGTTFSIIEKGATWSTSDEKAQLVKGSIVVVDVIGPYSSRAKITQELDGTRRPIREGDGIYNASWSPGTREHIAFAGLIDLNGDGIDDNVELVRILESQGVVVDSWLDLRDLSVKGKGMTLKTQFLVLGAEPTLDRDVEQKIQREAAAVAELGTDEIREKFSADPKIAGLLKVSARMAAMKQKAADLGIVQIEYRKFLKLIGVKIPERQAVPNFASRAYTQGNAAASKDDEPKEEMKKDEGK